MVSVLPAAACAPPREPIKLGDHQRRPIDTAEAQSFTEFRAISDASAFNIGELGDQFALVRMEKVGYRQALRIQPQAGTPLLSS